MIRRPNPRPLPLDEDRIDRFMGDLMVRLRSRLQKDSMRHSPLYGRWLFDLDVPATDPLVRRIRTGESRAVIVRLSSEPTATELIAPCARTVVLAVPILRIVLNGRYSPVEIEARWKETEDQIRDRLSHELRHLSQETPWPPPMDIYASEQSFRTYLYHPAEIEARIGNVVVEVTRAAKACDVATFASRGDLLDHLLQQSKTWRLLQKHGLTEANERKVRRAVYTAVEPTLATLKTAPMRLDNPRPIPLDEAALRDDAEAIVAKIHREAEDILAARKADHQRLDWPLEPTRANVAIFHHPMKAKAITGDRRIDRTVARVRIVPSRSRQVIVAGSASLFRGRDGTSKPEGRVELLVSANMTPDELLQASSGGQYSAAFEQVLRVLRHEMTHVGDWKIETGPSYQASADNRVDDLREYYNDPLEVRAFTREVADDVKHYVSMNVDTVRPRDLFDRALESSSTWTRMQPYLTPENQKRVLRVAYRAVEDERQPALERRRALRKMEEEMRGGRRENPILVRGPWQDYGRAVKGVLWENTAILSDAGYDAGWNDGGCFIAARALADVTGGEISMIVGAHRKQAELVHHVVVAVPGGYLDGDGFSTNGTLLRRWRTTEGVANAKIEPLDEARVKREGELVCPPRAVAALKRVLPKPPEKVRRQNPAFTREDAKRLGLRFDVRAREDAEDMGFSYPGTRVIAVILNDNGEEVARVEALRGEHDNARAPEAETDDLIDTVAERLSSEDYDLSDADPRDIEMAVGSEIENRRLHLDRSRLAPEVLRRARNRTRRENPMPIFTSPEDQDIAETLRREELAEFQRVIGPWNKRHAELEAERPDLVDYMEEVDQAARENAYETIRGEGSRAGQMHPEWWGLMVASCETTAQSVADEWRGTPISIDDQNLVAAHLTARPDEGPFQKLERYESEGIEPPADLVKRARQKVAERRAAEEKKAKLAERRAAKRGSTRRDNPSCQDCIVHEVFPDDMPRRENPARPRPDDYTFGDLVGCAAIVKTKRTGQYGGVYVSEDPDAGAWSSVCEGHGTVVALDTLAAARTSAADTTNFCDGCRDDLPPDPVGIENAKAEIEKERAKRRTPAGKLGLAPESVELLEKFRGAPQWSAVASIPHPLFRVLLRKGLLTEKPHEGRWLYTLTPKGADVLAQIGGARRENPTPRGQKTKRVENPTKHLFVRVGSKPEEDLRRGVSYPMGQFGEPDVAHEGLSGYRATDIDEIDEALARLHDRMGIEGPYADRTGRLVPMFVSVYEGIEVGTGPDGESLFRPSRLIVAVPLSPRSSTSTRDRVVKAVMDRVRRGNPTHHALPLAEVKRWRALAARSGVSEVARGPSGFLRQYEAAKGRLDRLSPEWRAKREAFLARHLAEVERRGEPMFKDGMPTRHHLALIMWAYSPEPSRLAKTRAA